MTYKFTARAQKAIEIAKKCNSYASKNGRNNKINWTIARCYSIFAK